MPIVNAFLLTLPWLAFQAPEPDPAVVARLKEHYATVERELRARDLAGLTPEQRARRAELIEHLHAYRERGDFTRNPDFPGARVPYFVDQDGRLCAVANLLHETGEDVLVRDVALLDNHVWVSELAGEVRFRRWLDAHGLTFEEAVRIQGPMGGGGVPVDGTPPPPPSFPPPSGTPWTPADTPVSGPSGGASSPGRTVGTGTVGVPAVSGGTGVLASPMTPSAMPESSEDWLAWWEVNKLRWLEDGLRAEEPASDDLTRAETNRDRLRRELAPRLERELGHAQAEVRAAAAFALARAAGATAVPQLCALFDDPSVGVRESAILALGTSASEPGVHALLSLLVEEREVTPRARALAIVGLGVARMHGRGPGTDVMLAQLAEGLERAGGDDVVQALALHQSLAPSAALATRVRCASGHFKEKCEHEKARAGTRERALEVLRFDADTAAVLPELLDAVHGRVVDERRAAASALGEVAGALDALLTAHELEEEPLARGLLLLSIGAQGGERARAYLVERLSKGKKNELAWAALGLGLLAGQDDDEVARAALRAAFDEAGQSARESLSLALGLARDREAHGRLVATLADSRADRLRMFASLALGLIDDTAGHAVLLEAIASVSCPYARSGMALALALQNEPGDTERLARLLASERRPESLRDLALALGLRGSSATVAELARLLDADVPVAVHAATLDALGLALDEAPRLAATRLGGASNYAAWPAWVRELVQRPL